MALLRLAVWITQAYDDRPTPTLEPHPRGTLDPSRNADHDDTRILYPNPSCGCVSHVPNLTPELRPEPTLTELNWSFDADHKDTFNIRLSSIGCSDVFCAGTTAMVNSIKLYGKLLAQLSGAVITGLNSTSTTTVSLIQ